MVTTVATTVELLHFPGTESFRAGQHLAALQRAAANVGIDLESRTTYSGAADWLMLWGPGAPDRQEAMRAHVAAGKHAIALDLAYWQRDSKARITIDAPHPQAWVMRQAWPETRVLADQLTRDSVWRRDGPVIMAGIGVKAKAQYGADAIAAWEAEMVEACRADGRRVLYRRKRGLGAAPPGALLTSDTLGIERVLAGASLVITWHSNVAVDALRLGLPVICRDGAAAAICPSAYAPDVAPLPPTLVDRFLANLAWFQWGKTSGETAGCWRFLQEILACAR